VETAITVLLLNLALLVSLLLAFAAEEISFSGVMRVIRERPNPVQRPLSETNVPTIPTRRT